MQSISVFLNIAIFADFGEKMLMSAELRVCHLIHMFFGSSLGKVQLCLVSSLQDMCDRF